MEIPVIVLFLAAAAVVLVTSLFKQVEWTHRAKALVATVLSVVAAALATWATGTFDAENLWQASLAMFGASQAFYHLIFHGTAAENSVAKVGNNE